MKPGTRERSVKGVKQYTRNNARNKFVVGVAIVVALMVIVLLPLSFVGMSTKNDTSEINPKPLVELKDKFGDYSGSYNIKEINGKYDVVLVRDQKNNIEIKGVKGTVIKAKIDSVEDKKIKTEVAAVESLEFDSATIKLEKKDFVDVILKCNNFNVDSFECESDWDETNIPFVDLGDSIEFNVTSFSGYAGGKIEESEVEIKSVTNVDNCINITSSGSYKMIQSISNAVNYCINISTSNVTFDCDGNTITGSRGVNIIFAVNQSNITIKNCVLKDSSRGILFLNINDTIIEYNNISNMSAMAIWLQKVDLFGHNNTIRNNNCSHSGRGIALEAHDSVIDNNVVNYNSVYGISWVGNRNNITNNIVNYNVNGLAATCSSYYNLVDNNDFRFNNQNSLYCACCTTVLNNDFSNNTGQYCLVINYAYNSYLKNNTFNSCDIGIDINSGKNSTIIDNEIKNNSIFGIRLISRGTAGYYVADNLITKNNITNSGVSGIYINSSAGEPVENNTFYDNIINETTHVLFEGVNYTNYWNTTKTTATNIVGGNYIGGNYWGKPDGTGFSDTCIDSNYDGICDVVYDVINDSTCTLGVNCTNNVDYLPLATPPPRTNLTIWDSNDTAGGGTIAYTNAQIIFYANYTYANGTVINDTMGGSCKINFSDSTNNDMNFNSSSGLYEYNRIFLTTGFRVYNVTCTGVGLGINISDNLTLELGNGTVTTTIVSPTGTSYNSSENEFFLVKVNVSCSGGDCKNVNVSLDPKPNVYSLFLDPSPVYFNAVTYCKINISNASGDLLRVEFNLTSPRGISYISNGTPYENLYFSEEFVANETGTWICNITAQSTDGNITKNSTTFVPSSKSGAVSTTTGDVPFYTNTSNPKNCTLSNHGQYCLLSWWVNATGSINTMWEFYAEANSTVTSDISNKVNVTIVGSVQPLISNITLNSIVESLTNTTIIAIGEKDYEQENLTFYCSYSNLPNATNTFCIGGSIFQISAPYNLNCTFTADNNSANDVVYCRVWDGYKYSKTVSTSYLDNHRPSLTSLSISPNTGKYNVSINVTSVSAFDSDGHNLRIKCGNSSNQYNLCTSGFGAGQRSCTFNSPWTDNANHQIYCVVEDIYSYMSAERNIKFVSDNTPPIQGVVDNVEGDMTPKYWDTDDDDNTVIQINVFETGVKCRYSSTDLNYSSMPWTQNCSVAGSIASCNVWNLVGGQTNETNVSISCIDMYGNEQNASSNSDVVFGIDWTKPSISTDNDGAIHLPGYVVNFTVNDQPPGTIVYAKYCNDTTGICGPYFDIINGSYVVFNQRGVWYLRYNASDEAGNYNETKQTVVMINQLPQISPLQFVNITPHKFNATSIVLDNDSSQTLHCKIYHRIVNNLYGNKTLILVDGISTNGTYTQNISDADGYNITDVVEMYVNCNDTLEEINSSILYHRIPNFIPTYTIINDRYWDEDMNLTNNISLDSLFADLDGDTLTYTSNGTINITVDIISGNVSFIVPEDWFGREYVQFRANDSSKSSNITNVVQLTVYSIPDITMTAYNGTNYDGITKEFVGNMYVKVADEHSYIENISAGKINFTEKINFTRDINIDSTVTLKHNYVEIDGSTWPELDKKAIITFTGLTELFTPNIYILKDGIRCDNTTDCDIIYYNKTEGVVIFNVTGFSNYTAVNENTPPNITNINIIPSFAYSRSNLNCSVIAYDFEQANLNVSFYWYKNGVRNTTWDSNVSCIKNVLCYTGVLVPNASTSRYDNFTCVAYASDGTYYSNLSNTTKMIINEPPYFDFALTAQTINHTQNLIYDINCTDYDSGDIITYYDNTTLFDINSSTGLIFDAPTQAETGTYNVLITCSDGLDNTTHSFVYTIVNNAPLLQNIVLNSTDALNRTVGNISVYYTYYDPDLDPEQNYIIKWYNNSVEVGAFENLTTVLNGNITKGETWKTSINVYDGLYWSGWYNSSQLLIRNYAPAVVNATLNSTDLLNRSNGSLNAYYVFVDNDTIDSEQTKIIKWYRNGFVQPLLENLTTVPPSKLSKGITWYFRVSVFDGTDWSSYAQSNSILIQNFAPEAQNVSVRSTDDPFNRTNGSLTVGYTYFDYDGDVEVSKQIIWYKNGAEITSLENETTVLSGNTSKDDAWNFTIRVYDGTDWSVYTASNVLLVENTPPTQATPILFPDPAYRLDNITCYNQSTADVDADNVINYYNWYVNGVPVWTTSNTHILGTGNFSSGDLVVCQVTPYDGDDNGTSLNGSIVISNHAPTLTAINIEPNAGRYNTDLRVVSFNASDLDGHNLSLRCGDVSGIRNLCNSSYGVPERLCVFASLWSDDVAHIVYCVVDDNINESGEVAATFLADNTPPSSLSIINIGGDTTPPYWDTVNDNQTVVYAQGELLMVCRWARQDINFSSMPVNQQCIISGTTAMCNFGSLDLNISNTGYYISCEDQYGNEQNSSNNLDVPAFGTDWSAPQTTHNIVPGYIYKPPFNVTLFEFDVPVGTNVTTYCCVDLAGICTPSITCDDGLVGFNNINVSINESYRGIAHLRYYSIDSANNNQTPLVDIPVIVNNLSVVNAMSYTNLTKHKFTASLDAYDVNYQNLTCWLHHRLSTNGIYNTTQMIFVSGLSYNGTFAANISSGELVRINAEDVDDSAGEFNSGTHGFTTYNAGLRLKNWSLNYAGDASTAASTNNGLTSKINDGDINTYWQGTNASLPAWITLTFPEPRVVKRFEFNFSHDLNYTPSDYWLQYDDNGNFADGGTVNITVVAGNTNKEPVYSFSPVTSKYFRIYITATNGNNQTQENITLVEWEVYEQPQYFGNFTSATIDGGVDVNWRNISWVSSITAGNNITMYTRSAATIQGLSGAAWQQVYNSSGDFIPSLDLRYLQYRAVFATNDTNITPVLTKVNITYIRNYNYTIYDAIETYVNCSDGLENGTGTTSINSIPNYAPTKPILLAPSNLSVVYNPSVMLNFTASDADNDTITYYIYADTTTSPTTLRGITNNNYYDLTIVTGSYNWRVRAYDGTDWSDYSDVWNFTIYNLDTWFPETDDNTTESWQNWYTTDQLIKLNASDIGLGLNYTAYCTYDYGASPCSNFTLSYSNETFISLVCPTGTGCQKKIRYYSVDKQPNVEAIQETHVIYINKAGGLINLTNASKCYIAIATNMTNSVCNNSDKINSSIFSSTNVNSKVWNSYENNCNIYDSQFNYSTCVTSTINISTILHSSVDTCLLTNVTYNSATCLNSNDSYSTQYSGSLLIDPSDASNNSYYGIVEIHNTSVYNSILDDCVLNRDTINYTNCNESRIDDSDVYLSTLTESNVSESTVINSTIIGSYVYNITLINVTIINGVITSGNVTYMGVTYTAGDNLIAVYCGDNIINYPIIGIFETCLSCPADLGPCPTTPTGGGGGRGRCYPRYNCSEWTQCMFGEQTRRCVDKNKCRIMPFVEENGEIVQYQTRVCEVVSCLDGILNQDETDVDCGGSICDPCKDGKTCATGMDCLSGACERFMCVSCKDGILNQDEESIDCGGVCGECVLMIRGVEKEYNMSQVMILSVVDINENPVSNVTVIITTPSEKKIELVTDIYGKISLVIEEKGEYKIEANKAGYHKQETKTKGQFIIVPKPYRVNISDVLYDLLLKMSLKIGNIAENYKYYITSIGIVLVLLFIVLDLKKVRYVRHLAEFSYYQHKSKRSVINKLKKENLAKKKKIVDKVYNVLQARDKAKQLKEKERKEKMRTLKKMIGWDGVRKTARTRKIEMKLEEEDKKLIDRLDKLSKKFKK
ncbi:hypothetical protein DRJ17_01995 [Candidatus Woesearchaeota archaeon]|nr:MAG: hypothetical protein DRJ17_01995 [Candidatus Woesearchaeota archaeon]